MNWAAVAAFISALGVLIVICNQLIMHGQNRQRLNAAEDRMAGHDQRLTTTETRVNGHDVEIARLKGFSEGVRAMRDVPAGKHG